MYAFHKYTYCECMRGRSFLEQCVFFHQMETAAFMKTSQLAKKSRCLPEWVQENEEPYRHRARGTSFLSFRKESREEAGAGRCLLSARPTQPQQGRPGARSPEPAPRPRTLPLHTERTQSLAWPVSSRKARHRLSSWSHSLTAPPSFDLRKEPPRPEAALTVGAYRCSLL